jgi:hypothetical protein
MSKPPDNARDLTDHLLENDRDLRRLSRKIRRQQLRLKQAIGLEHFRLYLQIEDTATEWCFTLVDRTWAVARAQGRREGRRSMASAGRK